MVLLMKGLPGSGPGAGLVHLLRFLILGGSISIFVTTVFIFGLFPGYEHSISVRPKAAERGAAKSDGHNHDPRMVGYVSKENLEHSLRSQQPDTSFQKQNTEISTQSDKRWEFVPSRDADNYGLNGEQCNLAFPKLFYELEKSVLQREVNRSMITFKEIHTRKLEDGMVRGLVYNGELYVIEYADMPYTYSRAKATLNSLNRALVTTPERQTLPNIEFVFTTEDFIDDNKGAIWSYSKKDEHENVWLMPDFGYWSWPEVKVGPYREIRRRIAAIDDGTWIDGDFIPGLDFHDKKRQVIWRGNPSTAPELRGMLLRQSRGKSWASVRVLNWDDEDDLRLNLLPMEEHCRYMFMAHTEGRSFSGRGKYLLNCRSVMISHPLVWREAHHGALISSGTDANFVEVAHDFSDLERKVEYLIDHVEVAERIANNSVTTFRDRYLTPAAEACYWRALIKQYASVCDFEPQLYIANIGGERRMRATPFESWLLMEG